MKRLLTGSIALCLLLVTHACGGFEPVEKPETQPTPNPTPRPQHPTEPIGDGLGIYLDSTMTLTERGLVREDVKQISKIDFSAVTQSFFETIFGNTSAQGVRKFLDDRINVIVSHTADVDTRGYYLNDYHDTLVETRTVAKNIGAAYWFHKYIAGQSVGFSLDGNMIRVESPRVGIIQLGQPYSDFMGVVPYFTSLTRLAVLVHEARHSDCTGGLSAADKTLLSQGKLPENKACSHVHVACPAGHELEGANACDAHPWGAYSVGGIFEAGLYQSCQSTGTCTERDIQQLIHASQESFKRVLVLDDMEAGRLGLPDMSSRTETE